MGIYYLLNSLNYSCKSFIRLGSGEKKSILTGREDAATVSRLSVRQMTISQPPPPKKTLPACYVSILLVDNNDFTDLLKLMAVNLLKVSMKNAKKFWWISVKKL